MAGHDDRAAVLEVERGGEGSDVSGGLVGSREVVEEEAGLEEGVF